MSTRWLERKKKILMPKKLAEPILNVYQPESVADMQDALKDVFGPLLKRYFKEN